ncbi:citrate lyase subunit beta/citryl-CoA lyase [Variovorax sp. OAS795]|uniref:HpcH/HpaI aldolase/citrate lyase family protein n=1 Tax=Variovorax sp. OAS795 TaxID=3034231 RepID=UPI00339197ED
MLSPSPVRSADARTFLFVPGDRPERFDKGFGSSADALILDLEDAVLPEKKTTARALVASWLHPDRPVWIRCNAAGTPWFAQDMELAALPGIAGVMLPKAEAIPGGLAELSARLALPIIPLIETAEGLHRALDTARCAGVLRLAFGSIDFQVDLGLDGEDDALLFARSQLVMVSRLAQIGRPLDGVTADVRNQELLRSETLRARRLGFGGKLCIHPGQVATVHECLAPSSEQRAWAERVLAAVREGAPGATTVDGKLVDLPVVKKAEQIAAMASASTGDTA